tara:strand:+ start:168 stop:464 length:297 start_codon:yes stop_codon:yes gene_type:complete
MDATDLKNLKNTIENMTKYNQIEILRILSKNKNVTINENSNGSFINLTELDEDTINTLNKYISYVNDQENALDIIENEKDRLENIFFKDNKDNEIMYT